MARTFSDGVEGQPGAAPVSTLASGISIGAVSLTVATGEGARFPATGPFTVRLEDTTDPDSFEHVDCSSRTGDVLTIGATTFAWVTGANVMHALAKTDLDAFAETADLAAYQALSGKGAVSGYMGLDASGFGDSLPKLHNPTRHTGVGAKVKKSTNQSITDNGSFQTVTFDQEDFDTAAIHDTGSNTSRLTVPAGMGGIWLVTATVSFNTNGTGERGLQLLVGGTAVCRGGGVDGSTSEYTVLGVTQIVFAAAADYFEVQVRQNSGGALNVVGADSFAGASVFAATFMGA